MQSKPTAFLISILVSHFCQGILSAENWENLAQVRSRFFRATVADIPDSREWINRHPWLSEELLFIQSNTRILVCQNPRGELRYLALPTQVYPVPSGNEVSGMNYAVGMYYHFDSVNLSHLKFRIQLDGMDGPTDLIGTNPTNESFYAAHVLPMTRTSIGDLDATILSFAPVAADAATAALAPSPLPGPAGAFYLLRLRNRGLQPVRATVFLETGQLFDGRPTQHAVERNTLILSSPKGHAGIHLSHGTWSLDREERRGTRLVELQPGGEALIEARIALGEHYRDIMPVIHQLFLHSADDWLEWTTRFWADRLGRLDVAALDSGDAGELSRDLYYRSIIDNFNCLQTDAQGNLVAHYQGAPKAGTIWGIDYEPTIISILHLAPELARQGLLFTLERNRAPRSRFGAEHSTAILVSPLIIARKWLEATGNTGFFTGNPAVMSRLAGILDDLASIRAPGHHLYAARYSSDGPVGRRYDHGTNVKVWFALDSWAYILAATGKPSEAEHFRQLAEALRGDLERTMIRVGPFGPQISGGTNLGEPEAGFYLPEEILYYDGEDTGSQLAPIYGIYGFEYEPWVNYHRFARSLYCPTYEPEFGTLRWFPSWSMPVLDGTGFFSRLGGSVTPREMREALLDLHSMVDPTGSMYWWPMGLNFKQGLSRCSQGQGTWAWQYLEQWLGVSIDALARTLTIAPRGLPDHVGWTGLRLGNQTFDLNWTESPSGVRLELNNRNPDTWKVRLAARPFGSGASGPLAWETAEVKGNGTTVLSLAPPAGPSDPGPGDLVKVTEAAMLGEDGVVFVRYGPVDPFPSWYHLWQDEYLDVRFYVLNGTGEDWAGATVTLTYPSGWRAKARPPRYWPKADQLQEHEADLELGAIPSLGFAVAPFQMKGPHEFDLDFLTEGKSRHSPSEAGLTLQLPVHGIETEAETEFQAVLTVRTAAGKSLQRRLAVPVRILPIQRQHDGAAAAVP